MLLFVKGYKLRFLVSDDRDLYALIKGGRFQGLDSWFVRTGRTENLDAGGTFCSCPFFHDFLNLIVSFLYRFLSRLHRKLWRIITILNINHGHGPIQSILEPL